MNETVALHTILKPSAIETYESVHSEIPAELEQLFRDNGVSSWKIWRDGVDLFHVIEVENFGALKQALESSSVDRDWQATIAPLLSERARDAGALSLVWQLRDQSPTSE